MNECLVYQNQRSNAMFENIHLLVDERPIMILPTLAKKIGVEQAIMLQEFQTVFNGNSFCDTELKTLEELFRYWSREKIKDVFNGLIRKELLTISEKEGYFLFKINHKTLEGLENE